MLLVYDKTTLINRLIRLSIHNHKHTAQDLLVITMSTKRSIDEVSQDEEQLAEKKSTETDKGASDKEQPENLDNITEPPPPVVDLLTEVGPTTSNGGGGSLQSILARAGIKPPEPPTGSPPPSKPADRSSSVINRG